MNISIPDELKARMDAAGGSINWSRVAAEAFDRRLEEDRDRLLDDVRENLGSPENLAGGGRALEEILKIAGDQVSPKVREAIREEIGPILDRALDRDYLRDDLAKWTCELKWPLESHEDLLAVIREVTFGYHERVVDPLLGQLLFEVVLLKLSQIVERK